MDPHEYSFIVDPTGMSKELHSCMSRDCAFVSLSCLVATYMFTFLTLRP